MKKTLIILLSLLLGGSLLACASITGALNKNNDSASATADSSPLRVNYEGALPSQTQLLVGTFKLEGNDQAVGAEQAAELLVLWKAYRSLNGSDSASSLEVEALVEQIQETMTTEQIEAIAAMRLTGEDMMALMQERGMQMAQGGNRGNLSADQIATMQAQRAARGGGVPGMGGGPGGGVPGGGFGGGGMPAPGGQQQFSTEQLATLQAQRGSAGGASINSALLDALIALLASKA